MNHFGTLLRLSIFGESHGEAVGFVLDGCRAGIALSMDDFTADLQRRQGGNQKGTTPRKEADLPKIISGVFKGFTTGAPICILFENQQARSEDYEKLRNIPRPGHADFVASQKYFGFEDFRGGGHFSGRLTVCLVAAGVIARKMMLQFSPLYICTSTIVELGGENDIEKGLQKAIEAKDSVGGIIETTVQGIPSGLGEPFFNSVESLISHAVFSIPAIKGIEFGAGFSAASMFGSQHNDAITDESGKTRTNHAGGIVGGITNGNELQFRVVVKPTASTPKSQTSMNLSTGKMETFSVKGRHDLSIALRVPVVLEAVTALVLADLFLIRHSQTVLRK